MIIKKILSALETEIHPVAKVLRKGEYFKVVAIGFKKGMLLKEHKAPTRAALVIIKGRVLYTTKTRTEEFSQYDQYDIPLHESHSVRALEDTVCLLVLGL